MFYNWARRSAQRRSLARALRITSCMHCGRTFETRQARFCSISCGLKDAWSKRHRLDRRTRCGCGTIFVPRHWRHKFCSRECAAKWGRPLRQRACEHCESTFETRTMTKRFCSRVCMIAARREKRRLVCPQCGRGFGTADRRQRFCSVRCARLGTRNSGDRAHNWKGGRVNHFGYVRVRAPGHPRASKKNPYVLEHILVMERVLGRHLLPNERVHHRNGQRNDNRPENLELWKMKDPPGVRASDYHCPGCRCSRPSVLPLPFEELSTIGR